MIRENNDQGIQTTPFVAWEACEGLDQLEFKECFRNGFYGLGKVSNFASSVMKILYSAI